MRTPGNSAAQAHPWLGSPGAAVSLRVHSRKEQSRDPDTKNGAG